MKRFILIFSLLFAFGIANSQISTFPYTQDFETFSTCGTACGAACSLSAGWENDINDDIDWAVDVNGTTSATTGPSVDHNPGTTAGKYLYTEASGCNLDTALLVSPWFDFTNLTSPVVTFWYHMFGNNMGTMHLDAYHGGLWTKDIVPGWTDDVDLWQQRLGNLSAYAGMDSVRFRVRGITGPGTRSDMAVDDFEVFNLAGEDAGAAALLTPVTDCALTSAEIVTVRLVNYGMDTLFAGTQVPVSFLVGVTTVNETLTVATNWIPGDTLNYTFTGTADLSIPNTYPVTVWTSLAQDGNSSNDTLIVNVVNKGLISSFPYSQGFETGSGGWSAYGAASSWELGVPAGPFITAAANGVNAWVTNLDGDYNNNEMSYLESPCFDFSALTADPQLSFSHIFETETDFDETWVELSTNGGVNWTKLGAFGTGFNWYNDAANNWWEGNSGAVGAWRYASHLLVGAAGHSNVRVRFAFSSDGLVAKDGVGVDDIFINSTFADYTVIQVYKPASGCDLGTNEPVRIQVANVGTDTILGLPLCFQVNNGTPVCEALVAQFFPGDTLNYFFTGTADLSNPNSSYLITAYSYASADVDSTNDSAYAVVTHYPAIFTLPYVANFDTLTVDITNPVPLPGGWINSPLDGPHDWWINTAGTPTTGTGPQADHTTGASGNYLYVEDSGFDEDSVDLVTPCFDLSTFPNSYVDFWVHSNSSTGSSPTQNTLYFQLDAGAGWITLDTIQHLNNNWNHIEHSLNAYTGMVVRFRFRVNNNNGAITHDIAIDDFRVRQKFVTDLAILNLDQPVTSCNLGQEQICLQLNNAGLDTIVDTIALYCVAGNDTLYGSVLDTLYPGDTLIYCFDSLLDLSATGPHSLLSWIVLAPDSFAVNDTLLSTLTNVAVIDTFPFYDDFESGPGTWIAGGISSSWEFGTPAGIFIPAANSGINAWVTNLDGNYNNNEASWLISPCLNFSGLSGDPLFSFAHIFETENDFDVTWVDVSTDGGQTWSRLGTTSTGQNWYNDAANKWWEGTIDTAGVWQNAQHVLTGTAGFSEVRLRFFFDSDNSVVKEGVGIDDVVIITDYTDLAAIDIPWLQSDCELTNAELITGTFVNTSVDTLNSAIVCYSVNGGTANCQTVPGPFPGGDTFTVVFSTPADLSALQTYDLLVYANLPGDPNFSNDTIARSIFHSPVYKVWTPYLETFDTWTNDLTDPVVLPAPWVNSIRDQGQDWWINSGSTVTFNTGPNGDHTTGSGKYLYMEDSNYENDSVDLISPCFDLANVAACMSFWYHSHNGNLPIYENQFEVQLFDGANWITLDTIGDVSPNWEYAEYNLTQFSGLVVKARFRGMDNNGYFSHDIAIDDFKVERKPSRFVQVSAAGAGIGNTCDLTQEQICAVIKNVGIDTLTVIPVFYAFAGDTLSQVLNATLLPGDSLAFCFDSLANFTLPGEYLLQVWSAVPFDTIHSDDTSAKVITLRPTISSYPYFEDFESGAGGWIPEGNNSTWALGNPAKSLINGAFSGTHTWVTGGLSTGSYAPNEASFVQGPCFDFSALTAPWIKLAIWVESDSALDGAVLQSSVDSGATWQVVGMPGDPINWYTDSLVLAVDSGPAWTGNTGAWLQAQHPLTGLAGQNEVWLRLFFGADSLNQSDGFAFDDVLIAEGPPVQVNLGPDTTLCATSVLLDAGFSNGSYLWSNGDTNQITTLFASGSISIIYTDSNGLCSFDTLSLTLTPGGPSVNLGPDTGFCSGDSVLLDALNPLSSILWSNGATTQTIQVTQAGLYTVTVTDTNGCTASDAILVSHFPDPLVDLGNDTLICANQMIFLDAGNPAFTYLWSTSDTFHAIITSPGDTISVLVTDGNGCSSKDTIVLFSDPEPVINLPADTTFCEGNTILLDAGSPGFSHLWSTGDTTQTLLADSMGIYEVTVTNLNGCAAKDTFILIVNLNPDIQLGNDTNLCEGNSLLLDAGSFVGSFTWSTGDTTQTLLVDSTIILSVLVTDVFSCQGTDTIAITQVPNPVVNLGPDTISCANLLLPLDAGNPGSAFAWSTGDTTQTLLPTVSGTFSVLVTDVNSCTGQDTISLTVKPSPVVSLGNDTLFCAGNSLTLNAQNPGDDFLWSTGDTTQTIVADTSGIYSVTVSNAFGCVEHDTIAIVVAPNPVVDLGNDTTFCAGGNALFNAGNPGMTYLWSTGGTNQTQLVNTTQTLSVKVTDVTGCFSSDTALVLVLPKPQPNLGPDASICDGQFLPLDAGNFVSFLWNTNATTQTIQAALTGWYGVQVTDTNGCTGTDSLLLFVKPTPFQNLGPDTAICQGQNLVLNAGYPGSVYAWSTSATTQTLTVINAGNYSVTVTNGFGCQDADTIQVGVNPVPVFDLGPDTLLCEGQTLLLDPGLPGQTYLWSTGDTTQTLLIDSAATYIQTVINGFNCAASDTFNFSLTPDPGLNLGADQQICDGNSVCLFTGSLPGYVFQWSTGSTLDTLCADTTGLYSLTATDTFACVWADTVAIQVFANPVVEIGPRDTSICGFSLTLNAGTGFIQYLWTGAQTSGGQIITATIPGDYLIQVFDTNFCTARDTMTILMSPPAFVNLGPDVVICGGETACVYAGSGWDVLTWSVPNAADSLCVTTGGTWWVDVVDTNGCTATDTFISILDPLPLVNLGPDKSFCQGDTVCLNGGNANTWIWSDNFTGQIHCVNQGGTYSVTAFSPNLCSASDTISLTMDPLPVAVITGADTSNCPTVAFTGSLQHATSSVWQFGDGGTSTLTNPTHTYSTNPNTVWLIANNACGSDTSELVLLLPCIVGIEEDLQGKISVYPNPSQGKFQVEMKGISASRGYLEVASPSGKVLYRLELGTIQGDIKEEILLENLTAGLYFLRIKLDESEMVYKLIFRR
ncbi:MAG: T9SS type A sorting domain-containing protein [Bacteroidia bacterium]|nr:T9SS type A sorting domain-containing protein [Bacteroidia bacterium]